MERFREIVFDTKPGKWLYAKLQDDYSQRKLVMLIVCVALLLDNMLYMVIVPIIPDYLRRMAKWDDIQDTLNFTDFWSMPLPQKEEGEDERIGSLFASKAFIQLLINPFSGHIIDRVGYEKPMMIGLLIMFFSTSIFAVGKTYTILFIARSLQGVGSAFADTAGLAMIADRFTEETERQKMLGIAIAFISFGSLFAPPFGGILYELAGKFFPFFLLSVVCLLDGLALTLVMRPMEDLTVKTALQRQKTIDVSAEQAAVPLDAKPTPIWRLLMDPYIAICAGALVMANVSLAFLEPTLAIWMQENMKNVTQWQTGIVWLPAFIPHVFGVVMTIKLCRLFPRYQYMVAAIGLAVEGFSALFVPISSSFLFLMLPIGGICFGVALIDTALLPTLGYLVDTRHTSVYGSVYAIADISYNLAYSIGPVIAGQLVARIGFTGLNLMVAFSTLAYVPVIRLLKNVYKYDAAYGESTQLTSTTTKPKKSTVGYHQWGDEENDDDDADDRLKKNKMRINGGSGGGGGKGVGWRAPTDGYAGIGGADGSMPGNGAAGGSSYGTSYGAISNENYRGAVGGGGGGGGIAPDPPSGEAAAAAEAQAASGSSNAYYYNQQQQQQQQQQQYPTSSYNDQSATSNNSGGYYQQQQNQGGGGGGGGGTYGNW